MAVRPHVHEPLVGTVLIANEQVFKTKLAQVYPPALCRAWAGLIAPGDTITDPLAPTFSMVTRPEDRKRPIGQALPWKPHKQQITAEKASAAEYQLKRAALPPLLPVEMEPGQAVKAALEVRHPFTIEPALEPDLQEALALVTHHPDRVLGHRAGALRYWSARAQALLPATEALINAAPDQHLRCLLRGAPDHHAPQLGKVTHIALWREMLQAAKCIDQALLLDLLQGFPIVGPVQQSRRWSSLKAVEEFLPVDALSSRAWEFSDLVIMQECQQMRGHREHREDLGGHARGRARRLMCRAYVLGRGSRSVCWDEVLDPDTKIRSRPKEQGQRRRQRHCEWSQYGYGRH